MNTLGIGFDAMINIRSRRISVFHGFAVYFLAMLQALLLDYTPYQAHIRTDQARVGRAAADDGGVQRAARGRRIS